MSSSGEFRQRGGHQRAGSTNSLPRPGANPRASPVNNRRTYSGGAPPPPPANFQGQRSGSFSSQASPNIAHKRPSYSTASYNSAGSSTPFNTSGGYGGGYSTAGSSNGYGSSGYGNGLGANSSHQRRSEDDKYSKKPKRKSSGGELPSLGVVIGGVVLAVYAIIMTVMYISKNSQQKDVINRLEVDDLMGIVRKAEHLQRQLKNAETSKRTAESAARSKVQGELNRLTRENNLVNQKHSEIIENELPEAQATIERHNTREDAFKVQVGWLMDRTRRESKRLVLERFGPGPHKVEITYLVKQAEGGAKQNKFVIEMAPLELVPHAIHLFLEQVDHGLLDKTHFYLNGPHIVQSGPQPDWNEMEGNDDAVNAETLEQSENIGGISGGAVDTLQKYEKKVAEKKLTFDDDAYESYYTTEELYEEDKRTRKFQNLGLEQLAFPDYHESFPHIPWTVGFTGRPGGPDWYINKVDNTHSHGPGGQTQHKLNEQGDSCFGIISIEGTGRDDLAGSIYNADVYADNSEWHYFISSPIEVVKATILTKEPILDRHIHLDHLHSQHKVYDQRRKVTHGEGVDPARLPENVQQSIANKKGHVTVNKVEHKGQRPNIPQGTEA